MSVTYYTDPTIISANQLNDSSVNPPIFILPAQACGIVSCAVAAPASVRGIPVSKIRLYRTLPDGSESQVDERSLDRSSRWLNLFDLAPVYGIRASYNVTAVTGEDLESDHSASQVFTAFANPPPILPAVGISAGAYGPYPLLGSDVFINPLTKEAVIGPNGDFLTVNGLECFAQDLRTRVLTMIGELVLHPTFGFFFGRIIGSGQSNQSLLANLLRTRIIDAITADPRTYSIDNVTISAPSYDSWTISYSVYAIGVEDILNANLVFPFYLVTST